MRPKEAPLDPPGRSAGSGLKFGIVASRFNQPLVDALLEGAQDCLLERGVAEADIQVLRVPGAWEIPQALDELCHAGLVDGLVALGVVIRGETPHFEFVSSCAADGCAAVSARHRMPMGFGVLTCDTPQQALARSGGKVGNKGREAAQAAFEMVECFAQIRASKDAKTSAEGVLDG